MADTPNTPFVMHGARTAMAEGMPHIEEHIKGIERALIESPSIAFDLAKTLIESACKTILQERKIGFTSNDDLPRLFKAATMHLPFLPSAASGAIDARKSLEKTLSGLHTALQGVCELRNACGAISHGSEKLRPVMETTQALLVARTADAIIGFLHRVHQTDRLPIISPCAEYDENPRFNNYVDDTHGVIRIFEAEFKASDILFQMEPETYRVYLAEYKSEPDLGETSASGETTTEGTP